VKYMATDAKGNTAICVFNVVVTKIIVDPCATDVTPPVIVCPANIVKTPTTAGTCWNVSWTVPTATDNCSTATVTQTAGPANGSCIAPGTYTVTYKATDVKGNSATCSFTVTVNTYNPCTTDVTPPTIHCPANIVKTPTSAGSCWTISWTAPTATDNCGTPTVIQTAGPTNGSCLAPGNYGVTYKATDAKGNVATCSFTILVNPYLNCNSVTGNTIAKSCVNNVPSLTGSALSGHEYVWLKSTTACPNSTTQAIAGATGQHYTLPSRVTVTTYFVRCARPIGCTTWGPINESNCVTVYASDCAPTVCTAPPTPSNWMYLGVFGTSHYYKYTVSGDVTCTDAKTKAQNIGGRLPVIKSAAQNSFIQSKLGGGSAWVGLRRSGNTNTWLWDNNAVATYYNWAAGEPNDYGGNEDCVQMRPDGSWNDIATHAYNWLIAEIPCGGVGAYLATNDVLTMEAAAELSRARIEWINNTGYKNDFFTVEKVNATTGDFEKLEIVNNKYSTDLNEHYIVYDNAPTEGDNTYRIKATYVDGTSKISGIKTVTYKGLEGVRVFPNPATDIIGVDLSKYKGKAVSIYLYNQFGQQVLTRQVDKVSGETVNLDISQHQTGNYLIRVTSKGRKDVVHQVHIAK
jgi:HYR domain/Lectin C-type domain/Secretion system C-terminal sorting domain